MCTVGNTFGARDTAPAALGDKSFLSAQEILYNWQFLPLEILALSEMRGTRGPGTQTWEKRELAS